MNLSPRTAARHCRWSYLLLRLLVVLPWMYGCGGMDQTDIRKFAIKRAPDDDDAPSASRSSGPRATSAPASPSVAPTPAATPSVRPAKPAARAAAVANRSSAVSPAPTAAASVPAAAPPLPLAAASPSAHATSTQLADTLRLDPQLTEQQRRQMTLDHIRRISQALEAYLAAEGTYPARAVYSSAGQPLLSWRVRLLPHLGYESLYEQFHLDEPWDSPHNQTLAEQIPAVYQSPERCDTRTNYVLPCGSTTAFHGSQTKPPRRWEDGANNSVILVEVDDALAVLWTQPRDLEFQTATPRAGLGKLRGDGFFAVFGGGRLARIAPDVDDRSLCAVHDRWR